MSRTFPSLASPFPLLLPPVLLSLPPDVASVVPLAVNLLRSAFSSEQQLARSLGTAAGRRQDRVDVESMRQIRAAQGQRHWMGAHNASVCV